VLNIIVRMVRR